jgi:hypothetical protein
MGQGPRPQVRRGAIALSDSAGQPTPPHPASPSFIRFPENGKFRGGRVAARLALCIPERHLRGTMDSRRPAQPLPVCLRLLANPVRVGEPSRMFLEWHGTELMCLRGHGMLYVPEWPAIWSGRQRCMHLGPSWEGVFR